MKSIYPHANHQRRQSPNKYAPGIPRYTLISRWVGGTAVKVQDEKGNWSYVPIETVTPEAMKQKMIKDSIRKDWRGNVIPAPVFKGKMPVCRGFYNHRWNDANPSVCGRCKVTRKLKKAA